jgi:hypothetical protein
MNLFQSLNVAFFGLTLAAVFGGLNKLQSPLDKTPVTLWIFVAFLLLLRLKMCLDDHKYFGVAGTKSTSFKVGFFVGVSSWILWTLSAWAIPAIQTAYFLAGLAISVSTLWIVVAALRKGGAYREQYIWIATNAAFVMLLWAAYRRNTLQADGVTWGVLGAAVLLVIADIVFSKSVPELEH